MRLSTRIPTTAQLKAHESAWIEACHSNWGMVLMELAGKRAAEIAMTMWDENPGPIAIFCGSGNNGGDGMVVARYLYMCGVPLTVHVLEGASKKTQAIRTEGAINRSILEKLGQKVEVVGAGREGSISQALTEATLVVDALLGTGLDRPVEGIYQVVINAINNSGRAVLSVDLPSGINSDTGQIMGAAVQADVTVTFGFLKAGLLCHPGADYCGELKIVDIGLPLIEEMKHPGGQGTQWWLSTAERVSSMLPARPADAHKGNFGHLLTIAGSLGMSGASILSSKTALRAGAGLSVLATPRSLVASLPPQEVIYKPLDETASGSISPKAKMAVEMALENASAVVLGPGLSMNVETVHFVHEFVKDIKKPCLIDADGLNALSQNTSVLPKDAKHFVLTPHPKELARLLGISTNEVQADRIGSAQNAASRFGCTVVLKGSRTVIASHQQELFINPTGNAGMATAGSGDVLSGVIGGLLAQGMHPFEAAVAGTYIHGLAGDMAAHDIGDAGIIAGDIMSLVPLAISKLRSGEFRGSELELQLFAVPYRR